MKKKLLVLLIAVIPTLMPNLVAAVEIEIDAGEILDDFSCGFVNFGLVTFCLGKSLPLQSNVDQTNTPVLTAD
jgi:hypothetical protein